jgi:hypothetical protein
VAAQDTSAQSSTREFATPQITTHIPDPKLDLQKYKMNVSRLFETPTLANSSDDRCFFIRSYNFTRDDGNAPELKGVTNCTKLNAKAMRQTKKRPAKLVPLGW